MIKGDTTLIKSSWNREGEWGAEERFLNTKKEKRELDFVLSNWRSRNKGFIADCQRSSCCNGAETAKCRLWRLLVENNQNQF